MRKRYSVSMFFTLFLVFSILLSIGASAAISHTFTDTATRTQTAGYELNSTTGVESFNLGTTYDYTLIRLITPITSPNETTGNCTLGAAGTQVEYWYKTGGKTNISVTTANYDLGNVKASAINVYYNWTNTNQSLVTCTWGKMTLDYNGGFGDAITGLPQVGSDIGGFLSSLAPGVGVFLLIIGLFSALVGIVMATIVVVKKVLKVE